MKFKSAISGKVLLPGTVSFSTSYKWWLIRQMYLISASSLPTSASSPPWLLFPTKQPYSKKDIPGCIGIEMLFSLQLFSSFRCLFVIRFEWGIVLSSLHDIKKRGCTMSCPWEGTSTLLNCDWFYLKLMWIQETCSEFLVLKVEVKFTT